MNKLRSGAQKDFPAIDLLRFLAALFVMLSHLRDVYFMSFSETQASSNLMKFMFFQTTRTGSEFVVLFFIISGFLVGGQSLKRVGEGSFSLPKYFIDRATRIYVPLVPTLLFIVTMLTIFRMDFSYFKLVANFLSLQGVVSEPLGADGALWSLSYEVWFYILLGTGIGFFFQKRPLSRAAWFAVIFIGATVFCYLLTSYLWVWIFGVLVTFLPKPQRLWPLGLVAGVVTIAGIGLMQISSVSAQVDLTQFHFINRDASIVICGLGWGLVIAWAAFLDPDSAWLKAVSPKARFLASFSYSLYLIHLPIELILEQTKWLTPHDHLNMKVFFGYLVTATFILLCSYLFYFLFERHTNAVRNYFYKMQAISAVRGTTLSSGENQTEESAAN
jgi:peptidoglycan/LPS O-acetylase OafA/YrhL